MQNDSMDLVKGTVDILVLQTLVWGPMHGYASANWIRDRTGGVLEVEDAHCYKALHRLERQGSVEAEWGLSQHNRCARFTQASTWRRYTEAAFIGIEPTLA